MRSVITIVYLETYIDFMIGGLVNTENDYTFNDIRNWGANGWLTYSDQFSIILGYVMYIMCIMFPFWIFSLFHWKASAQFDSEGKELEFDEMYSALYEEFKVTSNPLTNYYAVYLLRRWIFVFMAYYYNAPEQTVLQVWINTYLSFFFLMYLILYKPYLDRSTNQL